MAYCRPAGFSDDEDDDDDFELSTDYDRKENYQRMNFEVPVTKESLFYEALKSEDIETMKTMLSSGFAVDTPLSGGWSPLMYACSFGQLSVVELLIGLRANVNFHKELFTPLMALCKSSSSNEDGLLKCLSVLVKHGANINATDRNACTALMHACITGHFELVRKLVDCKCDVNIQDVEGWSALFHAVNEGREDIIRVLLEGKARVDLIDKRKRSAFELAIQKGYEDLGKLVCSKKETRKLLLEQEEDSPQLEENMKHPVEELMKQLPKANAKSISGFPSDIPKFLWAMGLGHYGKLFAAHDMQLNEFLLITDDRLKELGVRFSVHRQRILASVRKFHLHHWTKASLGMKPRNQQMSVEDGDKLMCNVTKHLHVLNATINYLRIHQPVPIEPRVFEICESAIHQLNLISKELSAIGLFARNLESKEKVEPVDLIKPKKESRSYIVPILATTVLIGIVMWKKKINVSHNFFNVR